MYFRVTITSLILLPLAFWVLWPGTIFTKQGQVSSGSVLVIITDPPGAEVVIDGVGRGVTEFEHGLRLSDLSLGKHMLLVRKKWYRAVERELSIEAGKRTVIHVSLGRPIGYLSISSSLSPSRIEVKGLGAYHDSVHRLEVPVGRYRVTVDPLKLKPRRLTVKVEEGMETDVFVDFGPDARSAAVELGSRSIEVINRGRLDRPLLKVGDIYGARVRGYLVPEVLSLGGGSFRMGSENGGEDEKPSHVVYVDGFDMGRVEVTNAQYKAYCDATQQPYPENPNEWGNYFLSYPNHPVVMVSWADATAYCQWLSHVSELRYRLPTEAEWEYAARSGLKGKKYPWGDEEPAGRACFLEGQVPLGVPTVRVGSYPANQFGLYDMAGNVWEWCHDWYDVSIYRSGNDRNPHGASSGTSKVARGGAWLYPPNSLRCAIRLRLAPSMKHETVGFRVALVRKDEQ